MTDMFDDLAKAFKAGHDAGRSEAADEIERLREALEYIIEYCEDPFLVRENKIEHTLRKARAALGEENE